MRIKEILRVLTQSDADFSDHAERNDADDLVPMHEPGSGCEFCDAWSHALAVLKMNVLEFEPHDLVELPGGTPGRVVAVETFVRVEVQRGEHGPWATGSFRPQDLRHRSPSPEFTYWAENDGKGDIWERRESDHLMRVFRLARLVGPTPQVPWLELTEDFADIERQYGKLTEMQRP